MRRKNQARMARRRAACDGASTLGLSRDALERRSGGIALDERLHAHSMGMFRQFAGSERIKTPAANIYQQKR